MSAGAAISAIVSPASSAINHTPTATAPANRIAIPRARRLGSPSARPNVHVTFVHARNDRSGLRAERHSVRFPQRKQASDRHQVSSHLTFLGRDSPDANRLTASRAASKGTDMREGKSVRCPLYAKIRSGPFSSSPTELKYGGSNDSSMIDNTARDLDRFGLTLGLEPPHRLSAVDH